MVLDGNIGFTGAIMEKSIGMIVDSQIFTVSGIFQFWINLNKNKSIMEKSL